MTYSASFWMHLCVAVALKAALVLMLLEALRRWRALRLMREDWPVARKERLRRDWARLAHTIGGDWHVNWSASSKSAWEYRPGVSLRRQGKDQGIEGWRQGWRQGSGVKRHQQQSHVTLRCEQLASLAWESSSTLIVWVMENRNGDSSRCFDPTGPYRDRECGRGGRRGQRAKPACACRPLQKKPPQTRASSSSGMLPQLILRSMRVKKQSVNSVFYFQMRKQLQLSTASWFTVVHTRSTLSSKNAIFWYKVS